MPEEKTKKKVRLPEDPKKASSTADGEWVESFSQSKQRPYWKNKLTGESSWNDPNSSQSAGGGSKGMEKPTSATSSSASLADWEEHFSNSKQRKYWRHATTGETTWKDPRGGPPKDPKEAAVVDQLSAMLQGGIALKSVTDKEKLKSRERERERDKAREKDKEKEKEPLALYSLEKIRDKKKAKEKSAESSSSPVAAASAVDTVAAASAGGWEEHFSNSKQRKYWRNAATDETTWKDPMRAPRPDAADAADKSISSSSAGKKSKKDAVKESDWEEQFSASKQRKYWKNKKTGERSWKIPKDFKGGEHSEAAEETKGDDPDAALEAAAADIPSPADSSMAVRIVRRMQSTTRAMGNSLLTAGSSGIASVVNAGEAVKKASAGLFKALSSSALPSSRSNPSANFVVDEGPDASESLPWVVVMALCSLEEGPWLREKVVLTGLKLTLTSAAHVDDEEDQEDDNGGRDGIDSALGSAMTINLLTAHRIESNAKPCEVELYKFHSPEQMQIIKEAYHSAGQELNNADVAALCSCMLRIRFYSPDEASDFIQAIKRRFKASAKDASDEVQRIEHGEKNTVDIIGEQAASLYGGYAAANMLSLPQLQKEAKMLKKAALALKNAQDHTPSADKGILEEIVNLLAPIESHLPLTIDKNAFELPTQGLGLLQLESESHDKDVLVSILLSPTWSSYWLKLDTSSKSISLHQHGPGSRASCTLFLSDAVLSVPFPTTPGAGEAGIDDTEGLVLHVSGLHLSTTHVNLAPSDDAMASSTTVSLSWRFDDSVEYWQWTMQLAANMKTTSSNANPASGAWSHPLPSPPHAIHNPHVNRFLSPLSSAWTDEQLLLTKGLVVYLAKRSLAHSRVRRFTMKGHVIKAVMMELLGSRVVVRSAPVERSAVARASAGPSIPTGSVLISLNSLSALNKPPAMFIASINDLPAQASIKVTYLTFPRAEFDVRVCIVAQPGPSANPFSSSSEASLDMYYDTTAVFAGGLLTMNLHSQSQLSSGTVSLPPLRVSLHNPQTLQMHIISVPSIASTTSSSSSSSSHGEKKIENSHGLALELHISPEPSMGRESSANTDNSDISGRLNAASSSQGSSGVAGSRCIYRVTTPDLHRLMAFAQHLGACMQLLGSLSIDLESVVRAGLSSASSDVKAKAAVNTARIPSPVRPTSPVAVNEGSGGSPNAPLLTRFASPLKERLEASKPVEANTRDIRSDLYRAETRDLRGQIPLQARQRSPPIRALPLQASSSLPSPLRNNSSLPSPPAAPKSPSQAFQPLSRTHSPYVPNTRFSSSLPAESHVSGYDIQMVLRSAAQLEDCLRSLQLPELFPSPAAVHALLSELHRINSSNHDSLARVLPLELPPGPSQAGRDILRLGKTAAPADPHSPQSATLHLLSGQRGSRKSVKERVSFHVDTKVDTGSGSSTNSTAGGLPDSVDGAAVSSTPQRRKSSFSDKAMRAAAQQAIDISRLESSNLQLTREHLKDLALLVAGLMNTDALTLLIESLDANDDEEYIVRLARLLVHRVYGHLTNDGAKVADVVRKSMPMHIAAQRAALQSPYVRAPTTFLLSLLSEVAQRVDFHAWVVWILVECDVIIAGHFSMLGRSRDNSGPRTPGFVSTPASSTPSAAFESAGLDLCTRLLEPLLRRLYASVSALCVPSVVREVLRALSWGRAKDPFSFDGYVSISFSMSHQRWLAESLVQRCVPEIAERIRIAHARSTPYSQAGAGDLFSLPAKAAGANPNSLNAAFAGGVVTEEAWCTRFSSLLMLCLDSDSSSQAPDHGNAMHSDTDGSLLCLSDSAAVSRARWLAQRFYASVLEIVSDSGIEGAAAGEVSPVWALAAAVGEDEDSMLPRPMTGTNTSLGSKTGSSYLSAVADTIRPSVMSGSVVLMVEEALLVLQMGLGLTQEDQAALGAISPRTLRAIRSLEEAGVYRILVAAVESGGVLASAGAANATSGSRQGSQPSGRNQAVVLTLLPAPEATDLEGSLSGPASALASMQWLVNSARQALYNTHTHSQSNSMLSGKRSEHACETACRELDSLLAALNSRHAAITTTLRDYGRLRGWVEVAASYRAQVTLLAEAHRHAPPSAVDAWALGMGTGSVPDQAEGQGQGQEKNLAALARLVQAQIRAETLLHPSPPSEIPSASFDQSMSQMSLMSPAATSVRGVGTGSSLANSFSNSKTSSVSHPNTPSRFHLSASSSHNSNINTSLNFSAGYGGQHGSGGGGAVNSIASQQQHGGGGGGALLTPGKPNPLASVMAMLSSQH